MRALRLLIVEDNATDRAFLRRTIGSRADIVATIDETDSGTDAINLVCSRRFDVGIVDYHLVGKTTGAEVLAALANVQPDCRRILITGSPLHGKTLQGAARDLGTTVIPKDAHLVSGLRGALAAFA